MLIQMMPGHGCLLMIFEKRMDSVLGVEKEVAEGYGGSSTVPVEASWKEGYVKVDTTPEESGGQSYWSG